MIEIIGIQPTDPPALRIYDQLQTLAKDPVTRALPTDVASDGHLWDGAMYPLIVSLASHLDQKTRELVLVNPEAAIERLNIEYESACWLMGKIMEASGRPTIDSYKNLLCSAGQVVRAKDPLDVALIKKPKQILQESQEKLAIQAEWALEYGEKSPRIQQLLTEVEHILFLKEEGRNLGMRQIYSILRTD
jgi:hypothetical protein